MAQAQSDEGPARGLRAVDGELGELEACSAAVLRSQTDAVVVVVVSVGGCAQVSSTARRAGARLMVKRRPILCNQVTCTGA